MAEEIIKRELLALRMTGDFPEEPDETLIPSLNRLNETRDMAVHNQVGYEPHIFNRFRSDATVVELGGESVIRQLQQFADFPINEDNLNFLFHPSRWEEGRDHPEEVPIALQNEIKNDFSFNSRVPHFCELSPPPETLLRGILWLSPQRVDFSSWIAGLVGSSVARSHSVPPTDIVVDIQGRSLLYEYKPSTDVPETPMLQPDAIELINADLQMIPRYLTHLSLQYAAWLPYELYLLLTDDDPWARYNLIHSRPTPNYTRDNYVGIRDQEGFSLCRAHAFKSLRDSGWWQLPFAEGRDLQQEASKIGLDIYDQPDDPMEMC
ncbi:hypothetical protein MMC12_007328 [Toensbergia leucococca]|nr:hypothetical protein [Toensbergia leucococca]